ncbi:MAG: transposase [Armatimonadetes bacterium]|nr:transposase [Armatimonadota bacterium]
MKKSIFTEDRIVKVLGELKAGAPMKTILATHGVSDATVHSWRRKYAGMENDDVKRLRELERENEALGLLVAEPEFEISAVRKLFRENGWTIPSELRARNS